MNYEEKLKIANEYLASICDFSWNDLDDIKSLHDVNNKEEIIALCDDRLKASEFIFEDTDIVDDTEEDDDDVFIDEPFLY